MIEKSTNEGKASNQGKAMSPPVAIDCSEFVCVPSEACDSVAAPLRRDRSIGAFLPANERSHRSSAAARNPRSHMPPKADLPPRTVDHAYFAPGGLVQVDGSRLHDANSFAKAGLKTQYRWAPIIDGQKQVADMQPRMAKKEFAAEMKKHKAILTVLKKDAAVAKAQAKVKVAGIALAMAMAKAMAKATAKAKAKPKAMAMR